MDFLLWLIPIKNQNAISRLSRSCICHQHTIIFIGLDLPQQLVELGLSYSSSSCLLSLFLKKVPFPTILNSPINEHLQLPSVCTFCFIRSTLSRINGYFLIFVFTSIDISLPYLLTSILKNLISLY